MDSVEVSIASITEEFLNKEDCQPEVLARGAEHDGPADNSEAEERAHRTPEGSVRSSSSFSSLSHFGDSSPEEQEIPPASSSAPQDVEPPLRQQVDDLIELEYTLSRGLSIHEREVVEPEEEAVAGGESSKPEEELSGKIDDIATGANIYFSDEDNDKDTSLPDEGRLSEDGGDNDAEKVEGCSGITSNSGFKTVDDISKHPRTSSREVLKRIKETAGNLLQEARSLLPPAYQPKTPKQYFIEGFQAGYGPNYGVHLDYDLFFELPDEDELK